MRNTNRQKTSFTLSEEALNDLQAIANLYNRSKANMLEMLIREKRQNLTVVSSIVANPSELVENNFTK